MKCWKVFRQHLFFGTLLALILAAAPLMAGLGLNVFGPGETVSSSQVNENFSQLENQIQQICRMPGQVVFTGLVTQDGEFEEPYFHCESISLSAEDDGTAVNFTLEGVSILDVSIHAMPRSNTDRFCSTFIDGVDGFSVECFDGNETPVNTPFFLTLMRRQ